MREVTVDIELLGRVLIGRGLTFRSDLAGRAYDMRPVEKSAAGSWLMSCLKGFEERTGTAPTQFGISEPDLLILA